MKKLFLAVTSLCAGFCLLFTSGVSAQGVNDFIINSFSADYVLSKESAGGKLLTTEDIDLTFAGNNHGILRAIPVDYKGWNTKIQIDRVTRDGANEPYSTYDQNGNLVLKIGRAERTITGHHTYEIVYEQKHVVNFEESTPEFFWDVNGTQWSQTFKEVSATVHLPADALGEKEPACFSGAFKSTSHDCRYEKSGDQVTFATTKSLSPRENLTIAVPLKAGVFTPPDRKDFINDNITNLLLILAGLLIALGAALVWFIKGRDYGGRGVIIPEYQPPQDVGPAEAGLLYDYRVDSRDITAMLINLAIKRYLRIYDNSKKILFFKTKNYKLELLNPDYSALKTHEKQLMEALFSELATGKVIEMNKLSKTTMTQAIEKIRREMQKNLTDRYGYFEKDAKKLGTGMIIAGFIILFGSFFLHMSGSIIGGILAGFSLILFGKIMPRRSHAGTETYEKIKGLKLYMDTAEKDRLKMMQSVDRPYAEPSKSVEFYEKLLPYAIA
ncbi:MAG TPA: DUF2207 domain-containing protein, partial [Candidatus Saccharimonadales bacterium]|nr:DUF2207 domain-containing protein [Candidatus Saccharimonadales bacterium]